MKFNMQSLGYLFLAGLIGFTSCKKDEEETPAPTLVINSNSLGSDQTGGSASTGASVSITLTAEASEGISKISSFKVIGSTETSIGTAITSFPDSKKHTWTASYTVVETSGTVGLKYSVEDKKGKVTSKTFTISINDLNSYSAKLLGAQSAVAGSYFSTSNGQVYTSVEANANVGLVDISYAALGGSLTPTLLSWKWRDPANGTGLSAPVPSGARETYFASTSLTASDFTSINSSNDAKFTGASVTTSNAQFVGVETNKVYAFLTKDGKKGLVHIESISAGLAGSVTINVKVAP